MEYDRQKHLMGEHPVLKDEAYSIISHKIENGEFARNKIYSINVLAKELNMSRSPVRDAIIQLCNEEKLDLLPSRGFVIHTISNEEFESRYHVSNAIEGYCAQWLCRKKGTPHADDIISQLEHLNTQLADMLDSGNSFKACWDCIHAFHTTLLRGVSEPYFRSAQSFPGFHDFLVTHLTSRPIDCREMLAGQRDILLAINSGSCDEVFEAIVHQGNTMARAAGREDLI